MHCSYATRSGHALIGARLYLPAEQLDDPDRRTELGIPTDVAFRTKPQLAIDIITDSTGRPRLGMASGDLVADLGQVGAQREG